MIIMVIVLFVQVSFADTATIWPPDVTGGPEGPAVSTEIGVKFKSDIDGFITGIRFYKYAANTGTHVGNIWITDGTNLGQVTFMGESSSGWQQADFATSVPIYAGVTYIASYHTTVGYMARTIGQLSSIGVDNAPLHLLQNGIDGGNGIFEYSATTIFPVQETSGDYDWLDVILEYIPNVTGWAMIYSDYSNEINFVADGVKVFAWDNPTTYTNTSVLTGLGGTGIYCGDSSGNYKSVRRVIGANITSYPTAGWLTTGLTYYCAAKAFSTGILPTMRIRRHNATTGINAGSANIFMQ